MEKKIATAGEILHEMFNQIDSNNHTTAHEVKKALRLKGFTTTQAEVSEVLKSAIWVDFKSEYNGKCLVYSAFEEPQKMLKAILINPENKTVTVIELERGLDAIYKAMDCDIFACPITYPNEDSLYCDDEGLFKAQKGGVIMKNWNYPILGKMLVIGSNDEGDSVDVKSTVEFFTEQIKWLSEDEAENYRSQF